MTIRKSRDRRRRIFADIMTDLGNFGTKIVLDLGTEIVANLGDFGEDRSDCWGRRFWRPSWDFLGDFGGEGIWMKLGHDYEILGERLLG